MLSSLNSRSLSFLLSRRMRSLCCRAIFSSSDSPVCIVGTNINIAYYIIVMLSCLRSLRSLRPRRHLVPSLHHPCYYFAGIPLYPLRAGAGSVMGPRLKSDQCSYSYYGHNNFIPLSPGTATPDLSKRARFAMSRSCSSL
jgi:hypothetical protein